MGFKNMKRDDHGHVISNDEQDGQKCQHQSGAPSAQEVEDQKYNKEMKAAQEQNADMSEAFDDDYEEEFKEDSNYRAGRLVADLENFDWADESLVNRMNKVLNYKNYKTGTLEDNIAYNLEQGMSDKEAVEDAIYGMEVYGDQPPEDEFEDNRWGDNLDLNDRKTRETLANDYDEYRASKNGSQPLPERKLAGAMKQQPLPERKYIRYPNGQIRWKDEIYPDEGSLEDIAGPDALKEIVDANDEENAERNFENEIEKRFSGWRPHWTNRKKNGGAHFEHDAFLNSFDYDNKVYKNTDERIKWNRDMAEYYRKNGQENAAKEYEDNANFIEKNKDRFAKYEKQANDSRGRRWLQLYGENAKVSDLKRGLKDGKYTTEDLMKYLKGE